MSKVLKNVQAKFSDHYLIWHMEMITWAWERERVQIQCLLLNSKQLNFISVMSSLSRMSVFEDTWQTPPLPSHYLSFALFTHFSFCLKVLRVNYAVCSWLIFPYFPCYAYAAAVRIKKRHKRADRRAFTFWWGDVPLSAMWPSSWPNESNSSISGENFICLLQQTVVVCCFHVCLSLTAAWVISFLFASGLFLLYPTVLSSIFSHTSYNLVFLSPLFTCFLLLDFDMYGKCRQQKKYLA